MVPIVVASAIWGRSWHRQRVCFRCDNGAVVALLGKRSSPVPLLMHLLRCLSFYAALFSFDFVARHIPGVDNRAADAISRNTLQLFSSLFPQVQQVSIPQAVVDLLVSSIPDWGSSSWTSQFYRSLPMVSRIPPLLPMPQGGGDLLPLLIDHLASHRGHPLPVNLLPFWPTRWVIKLSSHI